MKSKREKLSMIFIFASVIFLFLGLIDHTYATTVSVSGRQIPVDGIPYAIKSVGYSPVPIGIDPETTPSYGDYFTSNYSAIYDRDFPLLRQMGANTIRLWGWNNNEYPCTQNIQCSTDCYCIKASGDCAGIGVCKQIPWLACIALYDPVCGCDGTTYSNECEAARAGVSILYKGECCTSLSAPTLSIPPNGATGVSTMPTLDWGDVSGATSYDVQVCSDSGCSSVVRSQTGLWSSQWAVTPALSERTQYWWRARSNNPCGTGAWSTTPLSFTTVGNMTYTLIFNVNPTAAGSIIKNPDKVTYVNGDSVQLIANPNSGYTFSSWSGDIIGNTNPVYLLMDSNKSVTANFSVIPADNNIFVSLDGICNNYTPCFSSIQNAIGSAVTFTTIVITGESYTEDVILNSQKELILLGGWDTTFTATQSNTTINGSLTISDGALIIENIILE